MTIISRQKIARTAMFCAVRIRRNRKQHLEKTKEDLLTTHTKSSQI